MPLSLLQCTGWPPPWRTTHQRHSKAGWGWGDCAWHRPHISRQALQGACRDHAGQMAAGMKLCLLMVTPLNLTATPACKGCACWQVGKLRPREQPAWSGPRPTPATLPAGVNSSRSLRLHSGLRSSLLVRLRWRDQVPQTESPLSRGCWHLGPGRGCGVGS